MSLFDEAAAFMKDKKTVSDRDENREVLIKKIRAEFENATRTEIERALEKLSERDGIPDDFNALLKKIRIWLED